MANKLYDENSVKAVADAIRAKNGGTEQYRLADMPQAIENIESGNSDIEFLWNNLSHFQLKNGIAYPETFEITIPEKVQDISTIFRSYGVDASVQGIVNLTINKAPNEFPITAFPSFKMMKQLKEVTLNFDTSNITKIIGDTGWGPPLETINGLINCPLIKNEIYGNKNYYSNLFEPAHKLREVRFGEQSIKANIRLGSSHLSDETIASIINGLAVVTAETVITFHQQVKDRLTEEQIAAINEKGWTLA